jgi:hypothetical protein
MIDFQALWVYNLAIKENCPNIQKNKHNYYTKNFIFCQERNEKMDDPGTDVLRALIIQAVNACMDSDLLDLIFKLLNIQ